MQIAREIITNLFSEQTASHILSEFLDDSDAKILSSNIKLNIAKID